MNQQPSRDTSSKATKTRMLHDWSAIFNEAFWPVYPRKTHKQAAYRAWMRLGQLNLGATSGKLTPDDLIGNVLVMLDWFRVNEWKGRETQHIPNPATWINAEDFSDSRIAEVL